MQGRMYASTFNGATVSAVQDFWQIAAASNVAVIVHAIYLGQTDITANDQVEILIHRGTGTVDGGTTPVPMDISSITADSTYTVNDTTQLTNGVILHSDAFSILDGWVYLPPPEDRILISGGGQLAISSDISITSATMNGTLIVEEIG